MKRRGGLRGRKTVMAEGNKWPILKERNPRLERNCLRWKVNT